MPEEPCENYESELDQVLSRNGVDQYSVEQLTGDEEGLMKDVFHVTANREYAVYFYTKDEGLRRRSIPDCISAEAEMYDTIRENTDLKAPHVFDRGDDYLVCSWIPGENLENVVRDNWEDREDIAFEVGAALNKLHSVSYSSFGELNGEPYKEWAKFVEDLAATIAEDAESNDHINELVGRSLEYIENNIDLLEENPQPVLNHGDFHLANILTENGDLCIIDTEGGFKGSREYEVTKGVFYWAEELDATEEFLDGYGRENLEDDWEERRDFYRVFHATRGFVRGISEGHIEWNRSELERFSDILPD